MRYTAVDHTFAICAYRKSSYLEECIRSLRMQTVSSSIIICTSTPNSYIHSLANKYSIPVYVNPHPHGISSDWNYAISTVKTKLVTIAHQDDIYEPEFLEATLNEFNRGSQSVIAFSAYYEFHNGKKITSDSFLNLRIKEFMLAPLKSQRLQNSIKTRRFILSLADPICCPSVTYVKKNIPQPLFSSKYKVALDWRAWERLSRRKGRFAYIDKPLVGHRMYSNSTTVKMIKNNKRSQEDLRVYKLFWPAPIAGLIDGFYSLSQLNRRRIWK